MDDCCLSVLTDKQIILTEKGTMDSGLFGVWLPLPPLQGGQLEFDEAI
jgi:cytoplasmic iron level regulating protein YaaA (DUF328/UPF0246 family)